MPNPGPSTLFRNRLLWSTQGGGIFQAGNNQQSALTAAQLAASGHSPLLDVNGFDELLIEAIVVGFTGGVTPNIQFEYDHIDDDQNDSGIAGATAADGILQTANAIPLWTPAAISAANKSLTVISPKGLGAAPTITGWTVVHIPTTLGVAGVLRWIVTGAPTAINWRAFVYGKGI